MVCVEDVAEESSDFSDGVAIIALGLLEAGSAA